jgi:hypothetical protein
MNEIKKSIQNMDKKVENLDEKYNNLEDNSAEIQSQGQKNGDLGNKKLSKSNLIFQRKHHPLVYFGRSKSIRD